MEGDLGWWMHNTIYRGCSAELYTWNLYNFINQCYPNKFNSKKEFQATQESQISSKGSYTLQFIWWSLSCPVLNYDIQNWSALNIFLKLVIRKQNSAKFLTFLLIEQLTVWASTHRPLWLNFLISKRKGKLNAQYLIWALQRFVKQVWFSPESEESDPQLFNSFNLCGTKMELIWSSWLI